MTQIRNNNLFSELVTKIWQIITYISVSRVFRPNFILVRQNLRDAGENYKNVLFGFMFSGVPCINSLNALYNFQVPYILKLM